MSYTITRRQERGSKTISNRTLTKQYTDYDDAVARIEKLASTLPNARKAYWNGDDYVIPYARSCQVIYTLNEAPGASTRRAGKSGGRKVTAPKTYQGRVRVHYTYTNSRGQGRSHVDVMLYAPHTRAQLDEFFANDMWCRESRGTFARDTYTVTAITTASAPARGAKKRRAVVK